MTRLPTPAADGTGCCWNPFCGAPLRNANMHFCEDKRRCQLLRCLVLSGQSLPTKCSAKTSPLAQSAAAAMEANAFVIPKRKLQPLTPESPVSSAKATGKKPATSKKRPLPASTSTETVALKWPRVVNQTTKPALTKAKAKKELLQQVTGVVSSDRLIPSAQEPGNQALSQSSAKNPKPLPEPTHVRLYDVSLFRGARDLDPKYFRDLFAIYRGRKGKTLEAPDASLASSWLGFRSAWNKDQLESIFGPKALHRSRDMVHKQCARYKLSRCYADVLEPSQCPGCGPSVDVFPLTPQQLAQLTREIFATPLCRSHLALVSMVARRQALNTAHCVTSTRQTQTVSNPGL